jgi:hypothetical protein
MSSEAVKNLQKTLRLQHIRVLSRYVYWRNCFKYRYVADPDKNLLVDIDDIESKLNGDLKLRKGSVPGEIKDDDWDLNVKPMSVFFKEDLKFLGIREHFTKNIPWEETVLFKEKYPKQITKENGLYGCQNIDQLAEYYRNTIDPLYKSIEKNGIIISTKNDIRVSPIYLHIGRYGDFIFTSDGNHRLSMVKILGIKKIPVRIWWRHQKWQQIRENLPGLLKENNTGNTKLEHLVSHPDLQDIITDLRSLGEL